MQHRSSHRIVPILDQRNSLPARGLAPAQSGLTPVPPGTLRDRLNRPLHDLRISVTDRCNFRCSYCMPKEVFNSEYTYLPHSALLTFEEITRLARQFVAQGVRKIRLTGGEPLLRKNIERLIAQLANLSTVDGKPLDISLTTNGSLLARKALDLKAAGLSRLTVSLDGLDDQVFRAMNQVEYPVSEVLEGIAAAKAAGFASIKVNMVVKRGTNDQEILPMARYFRGTGTTLRFIEYMDVGVTNGWQMDEVLPSHQVLKQLQTEFALVPLPAHVSGETAHRWGYADESGQHNPALGEIGLISSVTQAFCSDCSRARLTTEGQLYLCLFASQGHDLKALLRSGASDADLASAIASIWAQRDDRYSELRSSSPTHGTPTRRRVEMSYIGG